MHRAGPSAGREAGSLTFQALTHTDSRFANNGNQFSGEPPDQALCVGNGFTFEMVNQVVTVYSGIGAQLVPEATINEFYGLAPNITRTDPPSFGPFVFDPVCRYDAQLQRWFVVNTALEQDPVTGEFTGVTRLYIAVSATSDPTGVFASYTINTTRGDATDRNCPCFDDFPHIGADANGFYITTNRFSLFGPNFNGAQIFAASKQRLAAAAAGNGRLPQVVSMNPGPSTGIRRSRFSRRPCRRVGNSSAVSTSCPRWTTTRSRKSKSPSGRWPTPLPSIQPTQASA
ncbi:MAG: hypothetical protein H0X18_18670 [Geodermatophilaceae bacterium]|nr:hypothetical protein [Geodermatophilaceae bacterium]